MKIIYIYIYIICLFFWNHCPSVLVLLGYIQLYVAMQCVLRSVRVDFDV